MKKIIVKNFVIYSIPSIISALIPFIVLPITTNYLTLKDLGNIALFELSATPFIVFVNYGQTIIINSNWFSLKSSDRKKVPIGPKNLPGRKRCPTRIGSVPSPLQTRLVLVHLTAQNTAFFFLKTKCILFVFEIPC